jgi:hypothetical protein
VMDRATLRHVNDDAGRPEVLDNAGTGQGSATDAGAIRAACHRSRLRATRWPMRATLLRRRRSLGWPAKNTAAAFAQTGPLPMHAGRDPFHAGNFRRAEPENIASAEASLIILSEGATRRRQHRQAERQAGHQRGISDFEPINSHRCPQKSTDIAVVHHAVRRVGINHDGIEMSGHIKIREKLCTGILDHGLHRAFTVRQMDTDGATWLLIERTGRECTTCGSWSTSRMNQTRIAFLMRTPPAMPRVSDADRTSRARL